MSVYNEQLSFKTHKAKLGKTKTKIKLANQ